MRNPILFASIAVFLVPIYLPSASTLDHARVEVISKYDYENPEQRELVTKLTSAEIKAATVKVIGCIKLTAPAGANPVQRWYVMSWTRIRHDGKTETLANQENDQNLKFKRKTDRAVQYYRIYKTIWMTEKGNYRLDLFYLDENNSKQPVASTEFTVE